MRMDHLQSILSFLSLLSISCAYARTPITHSPNDECSLQAWVRAPDLAPGSIIQGDARLRLTTGCPTVGSASLGLRFKERSFVKASRSTETTKRPREEAVIDIFDPEHAGPSSPWVLPPYDAFNCSANMMFEEIVKNKDLWLVREEERVVFESTQVIDMGEMQPGSVRDVVRDFAILVPSTNFPPALDYLHSLVRMREGEFANVEAIYEYFVRVAFTNGTMIEIPAGFTAFHPLYDPPSNALVQSNTVQLQTEESLNGDHLEYDPIANYTAEIISKHDGFTFSQGSDKQFVKVAITHTGRARTFVEPLTLHLCIDSSISPKWSSEYTSHPMLQSLHRPNQILRATSTDFKTSTSSSTSRCVPLTNGQMPNPEQIAMPNATTDQIAAGAIVSLTSEPVQFLIDTDPRHATDFEMYYHTLTSALFILLEVPRTQDDPLDPTDIFELRAIRKRTPKFEAHEEAWVPWYEVPEVTPWRGMRMYAGNVSVSVYPAHEAQLLRRCVGATPGTSADHDGREQVVWTSSADRPDRALCSPVHYLAGGARAPMFVDGNATSVEALHAKTSAERDALAPFLEPVTSSPPEGEERVHRYYRVPEGHRPLIYVGETWVKKVAYRDEHKITAPRPDAMPNVFAQMTSVMKHMFDEL
ncbi:hypothetical protein EV363DRAFT_1456411 [Boletus edulis]|nr:hypothetical protein EV363DRAFT_1456411 [Boletus edulis]